MHRWQSLSTAVARQQCSRDIVRAAQGIEVSLRSFHVSAARAADERPSPSQTRPAPTAPPTRRAAAAQAGQEISRLPTASKLRIIRTPTDGPPIRGGPLVRGGFRGRGGLRGGAGVARGGARGGRGGRGRGRGRGGRGKDVRGPRKTAGEDFVLPGSVEPAEASASSILEAYEPHWRTETEIIDYTELMEIVEHAHARNAEAVKVLQEAEKSKDANAKSRAEGMLDAVSHDVKRGLDKLVEAHNSVFPIHAPLDLQEASKPYGMIGGVPVGKVGFGAVVEDAMRLIGNRRGHKFIETSKLAQRLTAGELVKFTDPYEKLEVTRLANSTETWRLRNKAIAEGATEAAAFKEHAMDVDHIGFESLAPATRGDLVKSFVSGRYENSAAGVNGDALKNIARITDGNATYTAGAKSTVLEALQSMLPKARPQARAGQAKVV